MELYCSCTEETGSLHGEAARTLRLSVCLRLVTVLTFTPNTVILGLSSQTWLPRQSNEFLQDFLLQTRPGQIVHLANKDLIIISVVIRIKWTKEKIASWLNHQSDFKPPTEYQCSLRVQRYKNQLKLCYDKL